MNITPILSKIIPGSTNAFGSTSPIHQLTITSGSAQITPTPRTNLPQHLFHTYANFYIQIPPIKVPNKMLSTIIVAQFVKIWDENTNYIGKTYVIFDNKI